MSTQILGLARALQTIHNFHNDKSGEHFGRHGNIKPDNILFFGSDNNLGKFVISDLGLTKFYKHRTASQTRSMTIGFTMSYRAPEVDIANAKMSRALDI